MQELKTLVLHQLKQWQQVPLLLPYGKAGILDTVNCITSNSENPTGIIYKDQSQDSLKECVKYFEDKKIWKKFSNVNINYWSQKFGVETFQQKFNHLY